MLPKKIVQNPRKLLLLSISLILVMFAFFYPMFTSAFIYNDSARCDACHVQENDEFSRTGPHKDLECTSCHIVTDFGPDLYSHNATTFECIECHTEQNETIFPNDAHYNFSNASNDSAIFKGRNEMCIACHTYIDLEIEWHKYEGMDMIISVSRGDWDVKFKQYGDNKRINYTNYTDYWNETK